MIASYHDADRNCPTAAVVSLRTFSNFLLSARLPPLMPRHFGAQGALTATPSTKLQKLFVHNNNHGRLAWCHRH